MAGFAYSTEIDEILAMLPLNPRTDEEKDQFILAQGLMVDRDDELSNFASTILAGQSNSEVVTSATGGVTITFASSFRRAPVVVACIGDDSSGATCTVKHDTVTETEFAVRIYDAAGVEQNGPPFRINWQATGV